MSSSEHKIRTQRGKVVSNSMDKTIVVLVEHKVRHPVYRKYVTRSIKYHAHDDGNRCNVGDLVSVTESRPISRTKKWRLVEILERAK